MINKLKWPLLSLICVSILAISSCEEDEGLLPLNTDGAVVLISDVTDPDYYNLLDIDNASVGFTVAETKGIDVSSVGIYKRLVAANGTEGDFVLHTTVSSLPASLTIPVADAVDGLGIAATDLEVGDVIEFMFVSSTAAGDVESYNRLQVPASCPSYLAGTYAVHSEVLYADNGPVTYDYVIELVGSGKYPIEDITGGAWGINYASLYGTSPRPGELVDVCENLSIAPVSDQFGFQIVVTDLVLDADGVISYKWNDTGYDDNGEVTLTPQ